MNLNSGSLANVGRSIAGSGANVARPSRVAEVAIPRCDPNPSNEASKVFRRRCRRGSIRRCANALRRRLCNCYLDYRWFVEVYVGNARRRCRRGTYCFGESRNNLSFHVAGVTTWCSGFTRDIPTCNVRRACRAMFADGARYCSVTPTPVWSDWCRDSTSCVRRRKCRTYDIAAFK